MRPEGVHIFAAGAGAGGVERRETAEIDMAERMKGLELGQVRAELSFYVVPGMLLKDLSKLGHIELSPGFAAMQASLSRVLNRAGDLAAEELSPAGGPKPLGLKEAAIRVFATEVTAAHDARVMAEGAKFVRNHEGFSTGA